MGYNPPPKPTDPTPHVMIERIISGAQTGVDRAALDVAMALNIPTGGWCPAGRLAEDGTIPEHYNTLRQTSSRDYVVRTERNVQHADATLILNIGTLGGGTQYTVEMAERWNSPCLLVQLDAEPDLQQVCQWLLRERPNTLNVAGPRESGRPGIHTAATDFLLRLLQHCRAISQDTA
jgi:hypothetical protein